MNTSIEPPTRQKRVDPDTNTRKLMNLKQEARLLLQAARHYDGRGNVWAEDCQFAWALVKTLANMKIKGVG